MLAFAMPRRHAQRWSEISHYLDDVLDVEGEAREAWLQNLERRAPETAARIRAYLIELERLNAQDFMGGTAADGILATTLRGERFGAYTLEREIGHGGMGTVWLAHRSDGQFDGQAAVKLLNRALVGHPAQRRFAREIGVLAQLQHPNIAHLLDAGVGDGGQPYLVLEYIRGEAIDQYCQSRQLGLHERIRLFLDVLGAVAHAHGQLIVHRDLKPSNILVTHDCVVKLLDFGVAALLSPSLLHAARLTHEVGAGFTPEYAAPEQLRGEPVTVATDIYTLGVLLFVLLTGQFPVDRKGKSVAQLQHLSDEAEAPRPSDVAADANAQRLLRGDLDNILLKALHTDARRRYSTVDHFAEDLRHYLTHEPVSARPRAWTYVAAKFARRHRIGVVAATAVLLVVVGAVVVTTQLLLVARYQRDQAWYQSRRAELSIDFMGQLLRYGRGADATQVFHERLELGVELLSRQYPSDPRFAGRMLVDLAENYRADGEIARADALFAKAYEMGKESSDAELMVLAQCHRAAADVSLGIHGGAVERIEEAQRLLARMRNPDATPRVDCLLAQATRESSRRRYASAETLLRQAMRIREEADGTNESSTYAALLDELAALQRGRNRPREALRTLQRAAAINDRSGRGNMAAGIAARNNMALLLVDMGEAGLALMEVEKINQQRDQLADALSKHVAYPLNTASLLLRMRRHAAAVRELEGILPRARETGSPLLLATTLSFLGAALTQAGRWDEAEAALQEAASLAANEVRDAATSVGIETRLAELALARGALDAARRHADKALELVGFRRVQEERVPLRIRGRALLLSARVALAENAFIEAERMARDALAIWETVARGPDSSADVGEALLWIARARISVRSDADVTSILERAVRCLTNGLEANHPLTVEARTLLRASMKSGRNRTYVQATQ